jgi:DNA-directed RNA polymerase specialized sigma24 family protein
MHTDTAEQQRRVLVRPLAEQLYRERHRYLLRIARRNAAGREDAEDSVNAAFASFLEKFDPDCGSPPLAWVTLATKRNCWAAYRRRQPGRGAGRRVGPDSGQPGSSVESLPSGAGDPAERLSSVQEVHGRLAELKPAERRTLLLIGAGYSYREAGEITGFTYTKTKRCAYESLQVGELVEIDGRRYEVVPDGEGDLTLEPAITRWPSWTEGVAANPPPRRRSTGCSATSGATARASSGRRRLFDGFTSGKRLSCPHGRSAPRSCRRSDRVRRGGLGGGGRAPTAEVVGSRPGREGPWGDRGRPLGSAVAALRGGRPAGYEAGRLRQALRPARPGGECRGVLAVAAPRATCPRFRFGVAASAPTDAVWAPAADKGAAFPGLIGSDVFQDHLPNRKALLGSLQ